MQAQTTIQLSTDTNMPMVGFGTCLISNNDCKKTVAAAIDAGYRHIDTAEYYQNEAGVGSAIHGCIHSGKVKREDIFLTTKLWPGNAKWDQTPRTKKTTIAALNKSLARLQMEYVDLYLIHLPMTQRERLAQWKGLLELQQQGKARAIGVSNFSWKHIEEINTAGLPLPALNQIELHPWTQRPELTNYLRDQGIVPMAYSSLLPLSTWRDLNGHNNAKTDKMKGYVEQERSIFSRIAIKYSVTEAQLLLRWGIQQGYPVIPKSSRPERMRQNLDIFNFKISEADMVIISAMSRGGGVVWKSSEFARELTLST